MDEGVEVGVELVEVHPVVEAEDFEGFDYVSGGECGEDAALLQVAVDDVVVLQQCEHLAQIYDNFFDRFGVSFQVVAKRVIFNLTTLHKQLLQGSSRSPRKIAARSPGTTPPQKSNI